MEPFISAHKDPEGESPWAMQVVVRDTKDFSPLRLAFALSKAVATYLNDGSLSTDEKIAVERWMQGRIRKVVRRARNAAWDKVQNVPGRSFLFDGVELRILTPTSMNSIEKPIRNAQVSGLETIPNGISFVSDNNPEFCIFLNRSLNMSAPKAAVAAAHASQIMADKLTPADYETWRHSGFSLKVTSLVKLEGAMLDWASVVVHDAGLTEVIPGSVTAIGFWKE